MPTFTRVKQARCFALVLAIGALMGVSATYPTFAADTNTPAPASTEPIAPALSSSGPQPIGPGGNWTIAFDDEFDGSSLDLTKWSPNWYGEGGVMNKVGTYASNVAVAGGNLVLTMSSPTAGALVHTNYGAGRYRLPVGGYTEARISFPGSATVPVYNWPAWWASGPKWPAAGEQDIAEGLSGRLTANYHSPSGPSNSGPIAGSWGSGFHTYGIHRLAASVDVFWDGRLVRSYATNDNGAGEELILNVGASGIPSRMLGDAGAVKVDYVRAWSPVP